LKLNWGEEWNVKTQTPALLPLLFNDDRFIAYAFLDKANGKEELLNLTLEALSVEKEKLNFTIACDEIIRRQGNIIHKLAARSLIK
jgi:hypothetical protein